MGIISFVSRRALASSWLDAINAARATANATRRPTPPLAPVDATIFVRTLPNGYAYDASARGRVNDEDGSAIVAGLTDMTSAEQGAALRGALDGSDASTGTYCRFTIGDEIDGTVIRYS